MKKLIIAIAALAPMAFSCGNSSSQTVSNSDSVTAAEALKSRLENVVASGKVMFGHDDDPVYGHSWVGDPGRSDVMEIVGDYPGIMNWDLGGIEKGDASNLDSVNFERMRAEVIAQDARGGINAFSWHTVNPIDGRDSWQCDDTTMVARILNDKTIGAAFDGQVRKVARFMNSLTDASGKKIGVVFRPWHEHTGDWFWWGSRQCTPEEYRALWARTRKIMDEEGVDNLVWAYSPDRVQSDEQYMERYPGDELVDIMGADVYAYNAEKGIDAYRKAVDATLGAAVRAAQQRGKIAAFSETGLEGVTVSTWWTDVLLPALKQYKPAYVIVWRNAHDKPTHFFGPYPGHESAGNFKEFYNDSTTLFAADVDKIR